MTTKGAERVLQHKKFGKFYKQQGTDFWWTKDLAKHGGSQLKVYTKEGKNLVWHKDADATGAFTAGKHKGSMGKVIPLKHLNGK